jgi:hypothetical protein
MNIFRLKSVPIPHYLIQFQQCGTFLLVVSRLRIFHSYGDITVICCWRAAKFRPTCTCMLDSDFKQGGILIVDYYCDTGHPFLLEGSTKFASYDKLLMTYSDTHDRLTLVSWYLSKFDTYSSGVNPFCCSKSSLTGLSNTSTLNLHNSSLVTFTLYRTSTSIRATPLPLETTPSFPLTGILCWKKWDTFYNLRWCNCWIAFCSRSLNAVDAQK